MKKILTFCILILLVPGLFGFTAYAYDYQPVKAEIEVEVILGGKVAIIPNVNSPIPEKTEINLQDGEIGKFYIDFTEVGVYDYTVKMVPDDRDLNFDKTVYSVKIYVTDEGGALTAAVIASAEGDKSGDKLQRLKFVNTVPEKEQTTTAAQTDDSSNDKNRNPKTEDDTRMETYFLFAMLASAGLLALSILYLIDTQKTVNREKKK